MPRSRSTLPPDVLPSPQAFMSTTKDEAVALSYAASSEGAGFVFEIPQGMVDRGADIGFLSQV